ncbi:DUF3298 domain-containing protein [Mycobacterium koreense]|uniref:DUF3298 domain-containing protein n=1 Tax=Mycolicibacillus koreensis TaxID=1069220 RepID=A0A7I7SEC4_9MYCO|nr:DUF3298 domain-containing protein [Mycolicibacillus koreensis]MCV7248211.1 DUF3298 domain-containing protein [Mycolicibacillus koreensis]OSC33828.1 hypothetical protein B8W67_09075 [Mycolicibacillus koreensis]BBY55148.1 hypothetical protein MKOR_23990 [Mycolicibacillus koreensis]
MTHLRWIAALGAVSLLAAGCQGSPGGDPDSPPTTTSGPIGFCAQLGGQWNTPARRCTLDGKTEHTHVSVTYPIELIDDPTAGPALKTFVREFYHQHAESDGGGDGESSATLKHSVFHHGPDITSVVFDGDWYVAGTPHPNEEYTTFTFDFFAGRQMQLSDLFCPGVDPTEAIPPLIHDQIVEQFGDDGPLTVESFEPGASGGNYSDNYRAWFLDGDDLVVYMPAARVGPVGAAAVKARVPLTELQPHLHDGGCPT